MRAAGAVSLLALVGALSCAGAAPSHASSCDKEVAARIRFPARQACWTYRGPATLFVGKFSSGQTISAQMTGEATDYDPAAGTRQRFRGRAIRMSRGPAGTSLPFQMRRGVMTFVAPATGTYRFSFSPCAMWGAPGAVRICTR
jgi:hypothetical protein